MSEDINGLLNLVGVSENFTEDYGKFHMSTVFLSKESIPEIIICSDEHKKNQYLVSRISMASFFSLRKTIEVDAGTHTPMWENNQLHKTMNTVCSFFDNDPILGFCDQFLPDSKLLFANILFKKDDSYLCCEINLGDMLCMATDIKLPIYIRKEIINRNGQEYENTIKNNIN